MIIFCYSLWGRNGHLRLSLRSKPTWKQPATNRGQVGARFKASRNGHVNILIMYYTRERWCSAASHEPMGFFWVNCNRESKGGAKCCRFHLWSGPRDLVYQPLHQFSTTLVQLHRKYIFGNSGIFYFGLLRKSSHFFYLNWLICISLSIWLALVTSFTIFFF